MRQIVALAVLLILVFLSNWGCKKTLQNTSSGNPIDTLPPSKPDTTLYQVSGTGGVDAGEILEAFNTDSTGVLAILDQNGNMIKEKTISPRVENFQKWTINDIVYYTYFHTEGNYNIGNLGSTEEGYDYICDSNLNILSRVTLLPYGNVDTTGYDKLDLHDFILLGPNHYMTIADRVENPSNIPANLNPSSKVRVIACIIQEVNNGQVVFQWDGTDFPNYIIPV